MTWCPQTMLALSFGHYDGCFEFLDTTPSVRARIRTLNAASRPHSSMGANVEFFILNPCNVEDAGGDWPRYGRDLLRITIARQTVGPAVFLAPALGADSSRCT